MPFAQYSSIDPLCPSDISLTPTPSPVMGRGDHPDGFLPITGEVPEGRRGSVLILLLSLLLTSCSISYKFTGTSINYDVVKTISIDKFPIRSSYVWAPMESMFYNSIVDEYAQKTKLKVIKRNGDLQVSGEIVEYSQTNKSVAADGYSAQTQLKITVNVRFVNNSNHTQDFEQRFSATADYDSSQQLSAVQETLVQEMFEDIIDQIFNATVANW